MDGVFITCFADPGVHAAREITDAPVAGGFEPSFLTAMSLGDRVGVVTILPNVVPMLRCSDAPMLRSLTRRYGLDNRLGSIRVVDMPVLGLTDREEPIDRLAVQATAAVGNGEADSIVLGSTGMLGATGAVRDRLHRKGIHVPVVDPTAAAITWLESSIRLGLTPSRTTYMTPPVKARKR
ncbi:aspartate/glutamate racemase family protein [Rhodococcus sp. IEGM 1409]|uniref:aspartate/glutamate racemase family protein n=1 Tax=Rhodococcus sp. IEGM 1409 TaxID=3047082 RepID=UPI0024B68999|nr:aspartate/glutamate racemase family protein [Rhodococcus sp. IEGM 1409]MDI9900191.1 aspartate/glutamate racemase family protein [Rhodococcus sp. IEGM 1409]